jgi:hypothetical protein
MLAFDGYFEGQRTAHNKGFDNFGVWNDYRSIAQTRYQFRALSWAVAEGRYFVARNLRASELYRCRTQIFIRI